METERTLALRGHALQAAKPWLRRREAASERRRPRRRKCGRSPRRHFGKHQTNPLLEEALGEAQEILYQATPARVLRSEHLVAICLQTGRDKDRERVRILREQSRLDSDYLAAVIARHRLEEKWAHWTN